MDLSKVTFKKVVTLIVIAIGTYWIFQNYKDIVGVFGKIWSLAWPFIFGLILAFLINLPMRFIEKHLFRGRGVKLKRPISLVLAILFFLALIFFLIFMVVPQIFSAIKQLTNSMPTYWNSFVSTIQQYEKYIPTLEDYVSKMNLDWSSIQKNIVSFLSDGAGGILNSAIGVATSFISGTISFFISCILAIYVLIDKEHIGAQAKGLFQAYLPQKTYNSFINFASLCNKMFSKFISGQCLEGLAIGTIFTIVLFIGGFDYAILIGVLIGFMSLIPVFGTTIACIIGALLLLMSQGLGRAVVFVILFLVIQQLDGNLMYPHIVGTSVGLPAMWVMVAVTLGGSLMGVAGMFICIPIASIIYTLVHKDAIARLEKKGIRSPVAILADSTPAKEKKPSKFKNIFSKKKNSTNKHPEDSSGQNS